MRHLSHLALVLTVATLALLAPVAHAGGLDGPIWHSDYGDTQFIYRGTGEDPDYGKYDYYTGTLFYLDGSIGLLRAKAWANYEQVTFDYHTVDDQGVGRLNWDDTSIGVELMSGTWT